MFRFTALAAAAFVFAGCAAEISPTGTAGNSDARYDRAQMAAFAANSEFPSDAEASNDLRATALIDGDDGTVTIINASDEAFRDARVWINGNFVARLDNLPPRGTARLSRGDFYDRRGNALSNVQMTASSVQLQVGDNLYNLQGPVYDTRGR